MEYVELMSDLTIVLAKDETALVKINGGLSTCALSVSIDTDATFTIQSSLDSSEVVDGYTSVSEMFLENAVVDGAEVTEFTDNVQSLHFDSPNFLYFVNTSATEKNIKISLRGNR